MTHSIFLKGCAPTPLAHYLKALGILRLVSEQKDPEAKGCWCNEGFILNSILSKEKLLEFFLETYNPTPILTPWNGRGGFLEGEDDHEIKEDDFASGRKGAQMVAIFSGEVHGRFELIKTALMQINTNESLTTLNISRSKYKIAKAEIDRKKKRKLPISESENDHLKQLDNQIKITKRNLLQSLRNDLTGSMLDWFDACQIVSEKLHHAPLLGTGGLDGSMDFGVNYLDRLSFLFDVSTGCPKPLWTDKFLKLSLFDLTSPSLIKKAAIGQFLPGGAGGANSSTGFDSESMVNPWDFILMLEGTLLLATNTTRRLQQNNVGSLSYPFSVRNAGFGSGANSQKDEVNARSEIWLPLWKNPALLIELRALFQEGRATIGRKPVKDGLDFARAISSLGVDRGINEFQRYGFLKRSGKTYLATPLGRMQTSHNPAVDLIQDLDTGRFLENLRRYARKAEAPGSIVSLVHQLESRLFELTRKTPSTAVIQDILILLGQIQYKLSISNQGREALKKPMALLNDNWLIRADDGSAEFRLAVALAGLYAADLPIRVHFAQVKPHEQAWDVNSRLAVWGGGSFAKNMVVLLRTRILAAEQRKHEDKPFSFGFGADCIDMALFLESSTNDQRISDLVQGLALLKNIHSKVLARATQKQNVLPGAYVILKPYFTTDKVLESIGFFPEKQKLPFRKEILSLLAANQCDAAVKLAWNRLKYTGAKLPAYPNQAPAVLGLSGPRLLAALTIPLEYSQLAVMLNNLKNQRI